MRTSLILALAIGLFTGCSNGANTGEPTGDSSGKADRGDDDAAAYIDITDWTSPGASWDAYVAWLDVKKRLASDFDQVCGDTFCEGEYGNLTAVDLSCSVNAETDEIQGCVWEFYGSNTTLDPSTGAIEVEHETYACPILAGWGVK